MGTLAQRRANLAVPRPIFSSRSEASFVLFFGGDMPKGGLAPRCASFAITEERSDCPPTVYILTILIRPWVGIGRTPQLLGVFQAGLETTLNPGPGRRSQNCGMIVVSSVELRR